MATEINLGEMVSGDAKVLSGRPRGERARKRARLDDLDSKMERITIVIPDTIWSLNSSFFLGMFEKSIEELGEDQFREKYEFKGDHLLGAVEYGISAAINRSSPLDVFSDS